MRRRRRQTVAVQWVCHSDKRHGTIRLVTRARPWGRRTPITAAEIRTDSKRRNGIKADPYRRYSLPDPRSG
jgi:hypothetical protein